MKLVRIDPEACDGCGLCVDACHEGALALVGGKAGLVREQLCDGLGACLPACPQGALTLLDDAPSPPAPGASSPPVHAGQGGNDHAHAAHVCPSARERGFARPETHDVPTDSPSEVGSTANVAPSELAHWPVQLALVAPGASFLRGADLLLTADCVPFAVPDFHARYLRGRALLVGCPKLDDLAAYEEKLAHIFAEAAPRSVTVLRMEVPCCAGLATAASRALERVRPGLTTDVRVIGIRDGRECAPSSHRSLMGRRPESLPR